MKFRRVGKRGEPYPAWLRALGKVSGVYVIKLDPGIFSSGGIVYVGESHSGRLKKTMTRHFQQWERNPALFDFHGYGRHTGHVYNRDKASVYFETTTPKRAPARQLELIQKLRPRDNDIGQLDEDDEPIPF